MKHFGLLASLALVALSLTTTNDVKAAVGRTQGTFDVSATGAAIYTIPIWNPPGPHGLAPNLALTYNSQIGEGAMGPGWNLTGLSAITRCNKTYAQDGAPAPIQLAVADGYCLNGSRLRVTSGASTYGLDGSTYQTELADFSLITAKSSLGNGPAYFIVNGKDGLIYEYGHTTDSAIILNSTAYQWLLNKVSDRLGNSYVITYGTGQTGSVGIGVPLTISYSPTSAAATTYQYSIQFAYTTNSASGTQSGYVSGSPVVDTSLLSSITIQKADGSATMRKYSLGYELSPVTSRNRPKTITECADVAMTNCLTPTTISYASATAGVSNSASVALPVASRGNWLFKTFNDINGDGYQDLILADTSTSGSQGCQVSFGSATGFGPLVATGMTSRGCLVGDLLGNGTRQLLGNNGGTWWAYSWNGSTFVGSSLGIPYDATGPSPFGSTAPGFELADVNGDGLPDVIQEYYFWGKATGDIVACGHIGVYVRLNTSSGGTASFSPTLAQYYFTKSASYGSASFYSPSYLDSRGVVRGVDFNGDGRDDLVLTIGLPDRVTSNTVILRAGNSAYTSTQLSTQSIYTPWAIPIDWNNDACTDFIVGTQLFVTNCNGVAGGTISLSAQPIAVMDWDGDEKNDLVFANGSTVSVQLSTGTGLSSAISTPIPYSSNYLTVDANADGLADLGFFTGGSGNFGISYYGHNNPSTTPDTVSSIADGYGVTYTVSYVPITQGSYTKGSGAAFPDKDIDTPLYVVNQFTATDGTGGTYTKTYSYSGARQNVQGRGFEGFQSVTVSDSRANSPVAKNYYRTDFPYTGFTYQQDIFQHDGATLISHSVTTLAVTTLDSTANNQRYFVYGSGGSSDIYEVGGTKNGSPISHTDVGFTFDNFGNVTSSTTTLIDKDSAAPQSPTYNQSWSTTVSNTITPDTTNWCLNLPTQTTVTKSAPSMPNITRTFGFVPDYVNCRITQQVVEPSSPSYKVTTDIGYDSFGNVNSTTVTGIGMTARTSTANFGTTGQFMMWSKNTLIQQTTYGYDFNLGVVTSITDPNNIPVSAISYDSFGRKSRVTAADGTYTTYSYNDCSIVGGGCQNGDPGSGTTSINKLVVIATQYDSSNAVIRDEWTYLDQFDRTIVTKSKMLTGSYARVGTQYDVFGNVARQTAPCDATSCSVYWYTDSYDALNRITQQQRPISASNSTLQTSTLSYQGMTTVITDPQSKQRTRVVDPNGWLRQSKDHNGYYQSFGYDAFGSLKAVTDSLGNNLFSANYVYGIKAFQTGTTDIDRGSWGFVPNALGEVGTYTDANGNAFTQHFDALSRMIDRSVTGEGTTTWTWGNSATAHNIGQLQSVSVGSGPTETYTYDTLGRLTNRNIVSDVTYNYDYSYNATTGLPDTLTYPVSTSSYRLKLQYLYQNGIQSQVKDFNAGTMYWQANAMNARGQFTQETLGNGVIRNRSFDSVTGWINSIQAGVGGGTGVQNESYLFDQVGNVTQRQNNALGLTESFYYDNLYRLDYSQLNGATNLDMTYDAMGRITNRTDVAGNAAWTYDTTHMHQVRQAGSSSLTYTYDANGNAITRNGFGITWSKYNYPTVINGSATTSDTLSYDANNQKWKQVMVNGSYTGTVINVGELVEKGISGSVTAYVHYIYAGNEPVAVYQRKTDGTIALYYLLDDHQGGVDKITTSTGSIYASENFFAYGARRNASTWSGAETAANVNLMNGVTRNGFTWQSQLDYLGVIHMKGRVEDMATGIFLSADPYITDPTNTQNYNRYAYVSNNPLSRIDPSGFLEEVVVTASRTGPDDPGDRAYYPNVDVVLRHPGDGNGPRYYAANSIPEIVVTASRTIPKTSPKPFNWTHFANNWWPGYQLGSCIAGTLDLGPSCGAGDWTWATIGVLPLPEVKGTKGLTYLYQKVGPLGEHLKFGITKNPVTRYTSQELGGGSLRILAEGPREEMLQLERNLHETLPIGPEEGQSFYIQMQVERGLRAPPY